MVKSVIKEIFIMILLIVAIAMILGIVLYEYAPIDKKVPSKVSEYALPEEMVEELEETIKEAEKQNIIQTYKVEAADLDGAERWGDYDPGKVNPFDAIGSSGTGASTSSGSSGNSSSSGGTGGSSESQGSSSNPSQGSFLNEVK